MNREADADCTFGYYKDFRNDDACIRHPIADA